MLLYKRVFFRARVEVYAVIAGYIALMMLADPFSYRCSSADPCIGCGFRAGVRLLLSGNIAEGISSNMFVGPMMVFAGLMLLDLLVGFSLRKHYRVHNKSSYSRK